LVGNWGPMVTIDTAHSTNNYGPAYTAAQLTTVITAALADWQAAGLDSRHLAVMQTVVTAGHIYTATAPNALPSGELARTIDGRIYLSLDACSYGWNTDVSSANFTQNAGDPQYYGTTGTPQAKYVDLLTVVCRELGSVVGLSDLPAGSTDLMSDVLATGVRRLPSVHDAVLANALP
jgi:hypothetical protein